MQADLTAGLVRVLAPDGSTGTGFVVSDDGLIVTCSHVVQSESSQHADEPRPEAVTVVFHVDGPSHTASVVPEWWRSCDAEDVAFLRLSGPLASGVNPLKLGASKISRGHEFYSRGYRLNDQFAQGLDAEGRIQSLTTYNSHPVLQLLTNQIDHGMSGAPIFDTQTQRVVGMANFFWETKQHVDGWLAGAVPAEMLKKLCDSLTLYPPQAIEDYLAAVREYCANLPYLTLHDIRPPKTLDEVYVPLKARPQPGKDDYRPKDEQERIEREALYLPPLSIAEVMQSCDAPHVMILGEPGAGKSTLLRQMAERAWDAPRTIGLSEPHLPLLVPLRQLVTSDGSLEKRLSHALASEMSLAHDLPNGFLVQWPQQTGVRWLILLDALDEVYDSERARLMQWLKGQFPYLREHRVIITSRPAGYKDDFDERTFNHYDLLPFTADQTGEFARKWFNSNAGVFVNELDRVRTGELRGTPLLLTIAAKVFGEQGELPERRAALYEQFVSICLDEAHQRDQKHDLSERLWNVSLFILARLASVMTNLDQQVLNQDLRQVVVSYLEELGFSSDEAEVNGHKVLRVLARRSGVLTQQGDTYRFIHPTFREYLTALAVTRNCQSDTEGIWECAISRWQEDLWREVALFVLGILSGMNEGEKIVTILLKRIRQNGDREALNLVGVALIERAKASADLVDDTIDALLYRLRTTGIVESTRTLNALTLLGEMRTYPRARDGLLALAHDKRVDLSLRREVAEVLGQFGWIDQAVSILLDLAYDKQADAWLRHTVAEALEQIGRISEAALILRQLTNHKGWDPWLRYQAIETLHRLGQIDEAARAWLALASGRNVPARVRHKAAKALGEHGRTHEAILAWQELARSKHEDTWLRRVAIGELGKFGHADEAIAILLTIANDGDVDACIRIDAATVLGKLRWIEEAATILLPLTCDGDESAETRHSAAQALIELGRINDLQSLSRDERLDSLVRARAAVSLLRELGAADDLMALLRDERVDASARKYAAEVLIDEFGKIEDAASILLALVRNRSVAEDIRGQAIDMLERFELIGDLLAIVRDQRLGTWVRVKVTKALGRLSNPQTLSDIDNIARVDPSMHVRQAAHKAADRIRDRIAINLPDNE